MTGEIDRERLELSLVFHDAGKLPEPQQKLPGGHVLHEGIGTEKDLILSGIALEPGKELIGLDEGCTARKG